MLYQGKQVENLAAIKALSNIPQLVWYYNDGYPQYNQFWQYKWDNTSTDTPDDFYIVQADGISTGRWLLVDNNRIPQVCADFNSTEGSSQILNKPPVKRMETYSGTSDASGNYTITYGTAYSSTPHVNPTLIGNDDHTACRITTSSTTGFTIKVEARSSLSVLGVNLASFAVSNVVGASVGVLVIER